MPDLTGPYADLLRQARYQSAVVAVFEMKHSLSPIYWMNISDHTVPFVGVIEHTNFIGPDQYGGKHILYVSNYLSPSDPKYTLSNEELVELYCTHLPRINPSFTKEWVENWRVFRDEGGQPIITTHYSQRIPDHRTPIRGLYLANTTQIYPEDRGMNYSARLGQTAARVVLLDRSP